VSIAIRPARREDAALIFALVRELAEYEKLLDDVDATEDSLARALFAAEPRVFCDIAEWKGEPCGFALWFMNFSSFRGRHGIYLEDLFVRPAHRGRGVGKALLAHLAGRCVAQGWTRFEWSVLDWNAPSIAFYRSLGAAILDEWKICRVTGDALKTLAARGQAA
jgi:diamine N-acetyltransferase